MSANCRIRLSRRLWITYKDTYDVNPATWPRLAIRSFHLVPIAVRRDNVLIGLWIQFYDECIVEPFPRYGIDAGASRKTQQAHGRDHQE
jgi:hypothetical protein